MDTLTTRITVSCLESISVTKKMLCKGGKQKICAIATVSYNKVFYTHPCAGITLRPPQVPFHLLSFWNAGMKTRSLLSQPLAGISMEHKQTLLGSEFWYWIRPLLRVLQGAELEIYFTKNLPVLPEISGGFPHLMFDSPWDVQQFIKHVPLPFEKDTGEDKRVPLPHKKFPVLCLKSWQEPLRAGTQMSHNCVSSCTLATKLHLQAVWMHKAFFWTVNSLW